MKFHFYPMDEPGAREIIQWRYKAPYEMYNLQDQSAAEEVVQYLLDPKNLIYRIEDEAQTLLAFCSFGEDAQVNGGDYTELALDLGLGLKPSLTGQGMGKVLIAAVLEFAFEQFDMPQFRVTIAAFNQRAQKAWMHNGFEFSQKFHRSFDQLPFVILIRPERLVR